MTPMVDYSVAMLKALAEFLACEPVIYLFGAVVFAFLCKGIKNFLP